MQKTMMFKAFCKNMAVSDDVAAGLEASLWALEPCLKEFLAPRKVDDGDIAFTLHELVLIAVKDG